MKDGIKAIKHEKNKLLCDKCHQLQKAGKLKGESSPGVQIVLMREKLLSLEQVLLF